MNMNKIMKKIVLIALLGVMGMGVYAQQPARVPAYRGMIERVQPNGYTLRTFLRGDEHKHWMMTEDGWLIRENKKGWLKYAKVNRKGEIVTSCRKAKNGEDRTKCQKKWLEKHGVKRERI